MKLTEVNTTFEQKQIYHYSEDGNSIEKSLVKIREIREPFYMSEVEVNKYGTSYADIYVWYREADIGIKVLDKFYIDDITAERFCDVNYDYETPELYTRAIMNLSFPSLLDVSLISELKPDIVPFLMNKRKHYIKQN